MPVINTNTTANSALRYLSNNSASMSSSLSKLASGSRITKASDDAAGLAVGTRLQSDVTVFSQVGLNANRVTATLQTADSSASNISDILARMKSLATDSVSDKVTKEERTYLQNEFGQLSNEINDIIKSTKVGDQSLMDGTFSETMSLDGNGANKITVAIGDFSTKGLDVDNLNISTQDDAQTALTALTKATDQVTKNRADIGATMSRFEFKSETINFTAENTSAASSVILDADVAASTSKLASESVKTQAAIAVLSQANSMPASLLSLLR